MTKENFLTIRWNNILTVALGIPSLIYVVYALSNLMWTEISGLIWLSAIGALYWVVVEQHTAVRFAWLRRNTVNDNSGKQGLARPLSLIRFAYNAVFWIFLLPFFTAMAYGSGFIVFTIIIFVRLGANLYANNGSIVTPEQYARFPFRA